jgi:hypothetical protein
MSARGSSSSDFLERFQAKHALGLDPGVETGSRQESKRPLDPGGRFSFVSFCVSETHHA